MAEQRPPHRSRQDHQLGLVVFCRCLGAAQMEVTTSRRVADSHAELSLFGCESPASDCASTVRVSSPPTPRGGPASVHPHVAQPAPQDPPGAAAARRHSCDKLQRCTRNHAKHSMWREIYPQAHRWWPSGVCCHVPSSDDDDPNTSNPLLLLLCAQASSRPRCSLASRGLTSSRLPCRVTSRSTSGRALNRTIPLLIRVQCVQWLTGLDEPGRSLQARQAS